MLRLLLAVHLCVGARGLLPQRARTAPPRGARRAAADLEDLAPISALRDSMPYLARAELLADDFEYEGPLASGPVRSRDAYVSLATRLERELPARLRGLSLDATAAPLGAASARCRTSLRFSAPVPPQVLPAQRARLEAAGLPAGGGGANIEARATLATTLTFDDAGRVRRRVDELVDDPFDALATIAHFELVYASRAAAGAPAPLAYLLTLREITRNELRQAAPAETEDERDFDRFFAVFVARNLALGGVLGGVLYGFLRPAQFQALLTALASSVVSPSTAPLDF